MGAKDKIICSPNSRMISILERLSKIPERRSILLIGPTGTGKELLAEYIHETSRRSDKPFIKVNCTGLTDTLIDSQLFGHIKGAFTDAHKERDVFTEVSQKLYSPDQPTIRSSASTKDFRGSLWLLLQTASKSSLNAVLAMMCLKSEKAKLLRPLTLCRRSGVFSSLAP